MVNTQPKPIEILGVRVSNLTTTELHNFIEDRVIQGKSSLVLNVNVHCLNLAYQSPWLRDFLNRAEIVFCDGIGVMIGAKILGQSIVERITYADWIWQLAAFAESHGLTFFFLGARPGIAEKSATCLQKKYPKLQIVGIHHGYFNKTTNSLENEAVIKKINILKPDILIVGFGMPIQERWLMENWVRIEAKIALTGGAVFDYISGNLRRAPRWMTDNGLEWLGRLLIEPSRLWKRYLIGNPVFLWRVLMQRLKILHIE